MGWDQFTFHIETIRILFQETRGFVVGTMKFWTQYFLGNLLGKVFICLKYFNQMLQFDWFF